MNWHKEKITGTVSQWIPITALNSPTDEIQSATASETCWLFFPRGFIMSQCVAKQGDSVSLSVRGEPAQEPVNKRSARNSTGHSSPSRRVTTTWVMSENNTIVVCNQLIGSRLLLQTSVYCVAIPVRIRPTFHVMRIPDQSRSSWLLRDDITSSTRRDLERHLLVWFQARRVFP